MTTKVGKILTLRGSTTPFYITFALDSMEVTGSFSYDDTTPWEQQGFLGNANTPTYPGSVVTRIAQQLQPSGFDWTGTVSGHLPNTLPMTGAPHTQGSPNVSLNFIVEVLYPVTTPVVPVPSWTIEQYRVLARDAVNTAFNLSLA